MAEMVTAIFMGLLKTTFWVMFKIFQIGGGLLFGYARTRDWRAGYRPEDLGENNSRSPNDIQTFAIQMPRTASWNAHQATHLVDHFIKFGRFLLQIIAEPSGIVFRVAFLDEVNPEVIIQAIYAYYPESTVKCVPYIQPASTYTFPFVRHWVPLVQVNMYPAPILTADKIKHFDPLISLTNAVSQLKPGERAVYTIAVLDDAIGADQAGYRLITTTDIHPLAYTDLQGIYIAEMRKSAGYDRIPKFEGNIQRVLEDKLDSPLYHTLVYVQSEAATKARAWELIAAILPHAMQFTNMPFNALVPPDNSHKDMVDVQTITDPEKYWYGDASMFIAVWLGGHDPKEKWRRILNVLQVEEIAALWHVPYEGFTASAIDWITTKQVELPKAVRNIQTGIRLGYNRYGGVEQWVNLPDDDRTSHMAIIGKTGTGKSSLLHQLIHADIQKGRGICVIDPHGTLVQAIVRHSIPKTRAEDVVILDFANLVEGIHYPPPLNILARPTGMGGDVAAGMLMSIFTKIYEGFGETQMAHTLNMALLTLSKVKNPTLLDVPRLFDDADFRENLLAKLDNFSVQRFWTSFLAKSPAQQEQMTYPVMRRLDAFYNNNDLLAMTCHPQPLSFASLIQQNKIILVSLAADEAKVPKLERELLGSAIISQLQMAAMTGAITQPPFLVYIDEAQQFVTTALSKMLSEARKSGLGLILANQYFKQLAGDTLEAVEGNIGALLAFEVGERDARDLALYMKPQFTPTDLVSLGKFRAAVSLRVGGSRQPAFSLETLPPPRASDEVKALRRATIVRHKSVARYTPMSYSEVMQQLTARYASPTPHTASALSTHLAVQDYDDEFIEPRP